MKIGTSGLVFTLALNCFAMSSGDVAHAGVSKVDKTGQCVCMKGATVLATYSANLCGPTTTACASAKQACVTQNQATCAALGGVLTPSTKVCPAGPKC